MFEPGMSSNNLASVLFSLSQQLPGKDRTGRKMVSFLCTLARPYRRAGVEPVDLTSSKNPVVTFLAASNERNSRMNYSSTRMTSGLFSGASVSNCCPLRIQLRRDSYSSDVIKQYPAPLSKRTAFKSFFFKYCFTFSTARSGLCFLAALA